jgi:hypothetical protein
VKSEETGEIVYTIRAKSSEVELPVYAAGKYTVSIGREKPGAVEITNMGPETSDSRSKLRVEFPAEGAGGSPRVMVDKRDGGDR